MKRFKIEIRQEDIPENGKKLFRSTKEEVKFQAMFFEDEIDIKQVMKQIVAGPLLQK